ncbi:MAG: hypothetical protein ACMUEK_01320 [Sodalis sp. (in: enterobacteria)]
MIYSLLAAIPSEGFTEFDDLPYSQGEGRISQLAMHSLASAALAIDIFDGIIIDLSHILYRSECNARVLPGYNFLFIIAIASYNIPRAGISVGT